MIELKNYYPVIKRNTLFRDSDINDLEPLLSNLDHYVNSYEKGESVISVGSEITSLAILLEGEVIITQIDFWGNQNIISKITEGQMFGEAVACLKDNISDVEVVVSKDAIVLFIAIENIINLKNDRPKHLALQRNLLQALAMKNVLLKSKIDYLSKRSIRGKVLAFLSHESHRLKSADFKIAYNRQELADYLSVDRSALSKELMRLKKDGYLDYNRNHFVLHQI